VLARRADRAPASLTFRAEARPGGPVCRISGIAHVHDSARDAVAVAIHLLRYLVKEARHGRTLFGVIAVRGPMPAHEVVSVLFQAADALQLRPPRRLVPRDVKRQTCMVTAHRPVRGEGPK